jgi:hypothetical protein
VLFAQPFPEREMAQMGLFKRVTRLTTTLILNPLEISSFLLICGPDFF